MVGQDLYATAFPKLDEVHIASLAKWAEADAQRSQDGQYLFRLGDRNFKCYSSVKRVATAVGDGSMAVKFVHESLAEK